MDDKHTTPMMRAARYRQEAKEILRIAERAPDALIKQQLRDVAGRYELLAAIAEKG
jgi:hypothetical protein